jgi:hypothetical protein
MQEISLQHWIIRPFAQIMNIGGKRVRQRRAKNNKYCRVDGRAQCPPRQGQLAVHNPGRAYQTRKISKCDLSHTSILNYMLLSKKRIWPHKRSGFGWLWL